MLELCSCWVIHEKNVRYMIGSLQLRESSEEKMSEWKQINLGLRQSLQSCQNELKDTQQLLEQALRSCSMLAGCRVCNVTIIRTALACINLMDRYVAA